MTYLETIPMKKIFLIALVFALATVACAGFAMPNQVTANYSTKASKQCISNIVYWYDSYGVVQSVYQNCNLTNQICQNAVCVNKPTLPIEPSVQNPIYNPPTTNPPIQNPTINQASGPAVLMFVKKSGTTNTWQKTLTVAANDSLDFTVLVKNSSDAPVNNVTTQIVLPSQITYTGNLAIDSIASAGNINSGISLGTINAHTLKTVTFSASAAPGNGQLSTINATVNSANGSDSDSLSISLEGSGTTSTGTAAVSDSAFAKIFNFFKTWYLWIIVVIVMIILFIIIFRRLSSAT